MYVATLSSTVNCCHFVPSPNRKNIKMVLGKNLWIFCALVFGFCNAKLDENMFGPEGSELLKELKESGVIDQFEEELEKMLHEQKNTVKVDDAKVVETEGNAEKDPVTDFIESYVKEKNIKLDSRILEHLANLPVSDEGEAKHYVHLTQVLDKIYDLGKLDDVETDKKVLDVIKRVKSLPVMKTSLNKLNNVEDQVSADESEKTKQQTTATNEVFDSATVKMVTDFIKNFKKKPEFLLDVVLPMLVQQGLISNDVVKTAKMYGKGFLKSEYFGIFIDSIANSIEAFASSSAGIKMIQLIPHFLDPDNMNKDVMHLVRIEAEKSLDELTSRLENSDNLEQVVASVAGGGVMMVNYVKDLLKDEMKMAIGNTFLISQGLPAIKPRKLTESLFDLANKCIKVFTTWKIDLSPYKDETLKQFALIEKEYITASEFGRLTDSEQKTLIARFLTENMVEPVQNLWKIRSHIFGHPNGKSCAESLLCHLNAHMKSQSKTKSEVTKVFSLLTVFTWTLDGSGTGLDQWKLYQAIWNGQKTETNCSEQYTPSGKENICHILPWQSGMMSLNFEHNEL